MISREANLPRKATRVAAPLCVEIDGRLHAVRDWSTTGIALDDLAVPPAIGQVLQARLHCPVGDSTLLMPVQLALRSTRDGVHGFEFQDLSAANRRVLRQYAEAAQRGQAGEVVQLFGAAAPAGEAGTQPPQAPLTLGAPLAPLQPHRPRHGRLLGSMLAGLAVLAAAAGIGYYNVTYQLEGTGFVSGSIVRVTANNDGQLGPLLVAAGARVEPNTPLFAVQNPTLRNEIDALEQHLVQLTADQAQLTRARRSAEAGLLKTLRQDWAQREGELANARKLYDSGAITQRDMLLVANAVQGTRLDYLRQVAEGATRRQTLDNSDAVVNLRTELAAKKVLLERQQAERVVRAPVRGKVYTVDRQPGEFVSARDPVVLLEADVTPSVLLRLPNDDALKLRLGMPATIYVPFQDRKYPATVSAVGLSAASAETAVTQEGGLNETLVKLDFQDHAVRLPANARVNVWIRNPALPWS
jgi:multidrug resistance efflux pump